MVYSPDAGAQANIGAFGHSTRPGNVPAVSQDRRVQDLLLGSLGKEKHAVSRYARCVHLIVLLEDGHDIGIRDAVINGD